MHLQYVLTFRVNINHSIISLSRLLILTDCLIYPSTGCIFDEVFYDLDTHWHPDLGFGEMACMDCECIPVSSISFIRKSIFKNNILKQHSTQFIQMLKEVVFVSVLFAECNRPIQPVSNLRFVCACPFFTVQAYCGKEQAYGQWSF